MTIIPRGMRIFGKTAKAKSQDAKAIGFKMTHRVRRTETAHHLSFINPTATKTKQAERGKFVCPLLIEAREAGTAKKTK